MAEVPAAPPAHVPAPAPKRTVVVAGAGQAGCQAAVSLREEGFGGRIVLVGEEPHPPYQRPPLSKGYVTGKVPLDDLWLHARSFYDDLGVELRLGTRLTRIDPAARTVELTSGSRPELLRYDDLVLALGARNRRLPVEGAELAGVLSVRDVADADELRRRLPQARSVVVVGGGFIGLEIAATAVGLGLDVTVLETAGQLMGRVLSTRTASFLLDAHRRRGMRVELGTSATAIHGEAGAVRAVGASDGRTLPADVVLVGIGALPNTEVAAKAGLLVDNGVVTDQYLQTSDPHVWAIGDCAAFPPAFPAAVPAEFGPGHDTNDGHDTSARMRLESVQNAVAQARTVAAAVAGQGVPFHATPWFWSDQADLKIQIAGLPAGHDAVVVRGDLDRERFSAFCFDGDLLLGVESVNRPADHLAARKLLERGIGLRPEDVERPDFELRTLVAGRGPSTATVPPR